MAHHHSVSCDNSKSDKVRFYQQALMINVTVWIVQLIVILFLAGSSLTLLGDWSHGLADILILFATHQIFASELKDSEKDHSSKKKWLATIAVFVLWGMAVHILYEAVGRIVNPVDFLGWPVAVIALFSTVGNFLAHKRISLVDECEHDVAHHANVAHLITDAAISLTVFVSAVGKIMFNLPAIDAWLGMAVAGWMLYLGWGILTVKGHHH